MAKSEIKPEDIVFRMLGMDHGVPSDEVGYLCFLREKGSGHVVVAWSRRPKRALRRFQKANPRDMDFAAIFACERGFRNDCIQAIKKSFAHCQIHDDWFTGEVMLFVDQLDKQNPGSRMGTDQW